MTTFLETPPESLSSFLPSSEAIMLYQFSYIMTYGNKPIMALWFHLLSSELQMARPTRWANGKHTRWPRSTAVSIVTVACDAQVYFTGPDADCHLLTECFSFPQHEDRYQELEMWWVSTLASFRPRWLESPPTRFTSWTGESLTQHLKISHWSSVGEIGMICTLFCHFAWTFSIYIHS